MSIEIAPKGEITTSITPKRQKTNADAEKQKTIWMGHTGCRRSATSRSIVTRSANVRTGTSFARVKFTRSSLDLLLPEILEFHRRRYEPNVTAFFY